MKAIEAEFISVNESIIELTKLVSTLTDKVLMLEKTKKAQFELIAKLEAQIKKEVEA